MAKVLSIILGGGKGTRLYPLTKERAKPAVPFGGKYRLVDIPISNCINSGFKQIYVLTQFNSVSLHNHISNTYIFDVFSRGFVEILAAEQTFENAKWYQGTADAVRQNFGHFHTQNPTHYIILSGDQLYRMDLVDMFRKHIESGAKISIASTPVTRERASDLGILQADSKSRIKKFIEKPGPTKDIANLKIPDAIHPDKEMQAEGREYLASMGMYIFDADALDMALDNDATDFGNEIIPDQIGRVPVNAYIFTDYWEDIGTIRSFYDANLNLASINPDFNFYDAAMPIYTHRRHLPATKMNRCTISGTLTGEGCIITNAEINNSVIGVRSVIETGAELDGVISLGANSYETEEQKKMNKAQGVPNIGIGSNTSIRRAIIDMNARIGDDCKIGLNPEERTDGDYEYCYIRDGIIIIPKKMVIPPGTEIF